MEGNVISMLGNQRRTKQMRKCLAFIKGSTCQTPRHLKVAFSVLVEMCTILHVPQAFPAVAELFSKQLSLHTTRALQSSYFHSSGGYIQLRQLPSVQVGGHRGSFLLSIHCSLEAHLINIVFTSSSETNSNTANLAKDRTSLLSSFLLQLTFTSLLTGQHVHLWVPTLLYMPLLHKGRCVNAALVQIDLSAPILSSDVSVLASYTYCLSSLATNKCWSILKSS